MCQRHKAPLSLFMAKWARFLISIIQMLMLRLQRKQQKWMRGGGFLALAQLERSPWIEVIEAESARRDCQYCLNNHQLIDTSVYHWVTPPRKLTIKTCQVCAKTNYLSVCWSRGNALPSKSSWRHSRAPALLKALTFLVLFPSHIDRHFLSTALHC